MPKIHDVDFSELARMELREMGIEVSDHSEDYERWKANPVDFIDEHDLVGGKLYAKQRQFVLDLVAWGTDDEGRPRPFINDALAKKTRQVGMSWLLMSIELWLILFWGPVRIGNAHQNFTDVDDGGQNSTVRSLHGRIREMYERRIPAWLRFKERLRFKEALISNEHGGFIAAFGASPNIGRGSTFDMFVLDEFAHMQWSRLIWASITQACKRGKIANSTPNGKGNEYYKLSKTARRRRLHVLEFHWTEHEVYMQGMHVVGDDADCEACRNAVAKQAGELVSDDAVIHWGPVGTITSPWYDNECETLGDDVLIAQELDMSFEGSVKARVYPEFARAKHAVACDRNPHVPLLCGWDFGFSGATVLILAQVERFASHIAIEVLAYHENAGQVIDDYVPVVRAWEQLYGGIKHVGDPAGLAKNISSGKGPIEALREHSVHVDSPYWLHSDAAEGIRLVRVALRGAKGFRNGLPVRISINPLADRLMECLENTSYPLDRNGQPKPGAEMPADNEYTHGSDAFRYLVHYVFRTMLSYGTTPDVEDPEGSLFMAGVLTMDF